MLLHLLSWFNCGFQGCFGGVFGVGFFLVRAIRTRASAGSTLVLTADLHRVPEIILALAGGNAAKCPARLRLRVPVIKRLSRRGDLRHGRIPALRDNGRATDQLLLARTHVLANDPLQVVHVVKVNVVKLLDVRRNVARDSDIN